MKELCCGAEPQRRIFGWAMSQTNRDRGHTYMATFQDGSVRRATGPSIAAAKRSAQDRQCPKCGRKSALKRFADDLMFGSVCRWCDYENITMRPMDDE